MFAGSFLAICTLIPLAIFPFYNSIFSSVCLIRNLEQCRLTSFHLLVFYALFSVILELMLRCDVSQYKEHAIVLLDQCNWIARSIQCILLIQKIDDWIPRLILFLGCITNLWPAVCGLVASCNLGNGRCAWPKCLNKCDGKDYWPNKLLFIILNKARQNYAENKRRLVGIVLQERKLSTYGFEPDCDWSKAKSCKSILIVIYFTVK